MTDFIGHFVLALLLVVLLRVLYAVCALLVRTRDGGKSCKRERDCEGLCLARSRTCAPIQPLFGCNDILQDNGVMVTLCID